MRLTLWMCLVALVALSAGSSRAVPLNDYNEIKNGDFETGDFSFWQHGVDMAVAPDGPVHGMAVTCKRTGGDLWVRQIVDDSLSPEWNPDYHTKLVDLMAWITWSGWEPVDSTVSFRLDWWSERYNTVDDPRQLPFYVGPPPAQADSAAGYFVSDWVTYRFTGPAFEWVSVNPFNQVLLPIQPRWISVEVVYNQAAGEAVWLDDVVLTGRCVPEPTGLACLASALGALVTGLKLRRR